MPQLERFLIIWQVFYPYVQGKKHSVSSIIFLYLRLSYALYGTFILEKDDFSWNISSWCMPQLERFLNIWNFFYSFVQDIESSVSSTFMRYLRLPTALQGTLFWKKMIFHQIFQVGACPNLKDSLLYERYSIHMYKARSIQYLQQFSSICDSLMPWTVHFFFGKRWFLMKYFKLVHAPTWKIPYYMTGFLSICTRQEAFGIFNNFSLSATLLCLVRYNFGEKDKFLMEYFKLVHAPTCKIP